MTFVLDTSEIAYDPIADQVIDPSEQQADAPGQESDPNVLPFDADAQHEEPTAQSQESTEATVQVVDEPTGEIADPGQDETPSEEGNHSDDQYFKHLNLLGEMAECVRARQRAASDWLEAKKEAKEANKAVKECKEIHDARVVQEQQITDKIATLMAEEAEGPKVSTDQDKAPEPTAEDQSGDWRVLPTMDLLKKTRGIGDKKLKAIAAKSPTVGDLEDLRGEASQCHQPFHSLLPDGCGQKMADIIEDKLIEHIAKFSESTADEQVEPRIQDAEDSSESDDPKVKLPRQERAEKAKNDVNGWRDQMEDQGATADDCNVPVQLDRGGLSDETNQTEEMHLLGFRSFQMGLSADGVPNQVPDEFIEEWAYGWACGERLKTLEEIKAEESSSISSL